MAKVFLGLGTNLGDKEKNLRDAVQKIEEQVGKIISLSAFYVTEPWGFESDNAFLNAVVCVETGYSPQKVLRMTQQIETQMGRTLKSTGCSYADRIIDIDLLMYDDLILQEDDLVLPHPLMQERRFVLEPLAEIAPELVHPVFGRTIQDLYKDLPILFP